MTQQDSLRIILLTTARTYRGQAFLRAAQKLSIDRCYSGRQYGTRASCTLECGIWYRL